MGSRKLMEKASFNLQPICSYPEGLPIYFLTGKNHLYQTLFCIKSLTQFTKTKFKFVLVDDGSFDNKLIKRIHFQLPGATVIERSLIDENLKINLPVEQYKNLHYKRAVYPHIKKLTDIHTIPGDKWKLVLDSDMLFGDEPTEMLNWLTAPDKPLCMIDSQQSYGYSVQLMENLCSSKIKPLINVGAIGLNSQKIDWDKVDNWVKILEETEGKTYYLEQALSAMLIGDANAVVLNKDKYIVNPDIHSKGVLHHYVDLSKESYYKSDWKKFIQ